MLPSTESEGGDVIAVSRVWGECGPMSAKGERGTHIMHGRSRTTRRGRGGLPEHSECFPCYWWLE